MIQGSCLCGAVHFRVEGALTPVQYCHAERCRKATGSAFAPELLIEKSGFSWLSGEEQLQEYTAPMVESPPAYKRVFCRICGSPLPAEIEGTEYLLLLAGVLDGQPDLTPFRHAFTGQKACWHTITDEMPQYEDQPPVPENYQSNPD